MSCKHFAVALLIGLMIAAPAWAFVPSPMADYEVRLPLEQVSPSYSKPEQAQVQRLMPGLGAFRSGEGAGWEVIEWNDALGTPSTMGGPAIPLVATGSTEDAVRAGIEAFVARNAPALQVDAREMRITSVTDLGDERSFVVMGQFVNGLEVIGGRLDFGLWKGNVVLIGSEVHRDVQVGTLATVDESTAIAQAHQGIPDSPADGVVHPPRLVILPIGSGTSTVHHLAWEVYLKTNDPENVWRTYVDARNATILWREGQYDFFTIDGQTRGQVELRAVGYGFTESPLDDERVVASGSYTDYSDEAGAYSITVPANTTYSVNTTLNGSYCNVNRSDGVPDATLTQDGSPSAPCDFLYTDTNSHPAERDVYYHVNDTHDWIKSVDPTFTSMDHTVPANVNINSTCNAFWNGSSVNFYREGGGCNNTGRIADVVSHEYGHGITQWLYYPQGPPTSSGMGEAFSDIYSMTMHGDALMGENFYTSGAPVRDGENLRQYPGSECGGQVHCLGEILMGAMWKTRKNFVGRYGPSTGVPIYDVLTIRTVKTKTTTMTNFLNRLLMNDDTDGNLANGTPNYYEICDAFAIHNLPCSPITNYVTVTSTPLDDQSQAQGGYTVTAIAIAVGGGAIDPTKVDIYYTTDIPGPPPTWLVVDMIQTGNPNEYTGVIPQQDCGAHVRYYVRAEKLTGEYATAPFQAPYKDVYEFMTGDYVATPYNLESDQGWTLGWPGDTATQGMWERADPAGKTHTTYGPTQPEDDHTGVGTLCFVTDARGGTWNSYDVDVGKTSVVSPRLAWSNRGLAEVRFWGFFFDYTPTDDSLRCSVSNDDGATWTDFKKIAGMDRNEWTLYKVYIGEENILFTDSMRVRFTMEDHNNQTQCAEAAIDDIEVRASDCVTGVAQDHSVPATFVVEQNKPNPFNPATTITFGMPQAGRVSVEIFDAAGRRVRTLVNGGRDAGIHSAVWDGLDDARRKVGSGVYYYTVKAAGKQTSRKMLLLK